MLKITLLENINSFKQMRSIYLSPTIYEQDKVEKKGFKTVVIISLLLKKIYKYMYKNI